jgi:hypothetical protein
MRQTARALLGVLLVAYHCDTVAAETRFRWWPFGAQSNAPPAVSGTIETPSSKVAAPTTDSAPLASTSAASVPAYPSTATPLAQQEAFPELSPEPLSERHWMIESPLAKVSWPRFQMPQVSLPQPRLPRPQLWPRKSQVAEARNAWVETNDDTNHPSPLQTAKDGVRRVGESSRMAWRKTIDALTPGDAAAQQSSRIARRDPPPPFWKRMFAAKDPQPEGPRTVTEWMAQDRLDP